MNKTIKNREEAIDVVVATLKDIEKRNPNFTIDIYGYYNAKENTLEVDTSWRNGGNCYTLICRHPSGVNKVELFSESIENACNSITHTTEKELEKMMEDEELDINDIGELEYFLKKHYADEIENAHNEFVDHDLDLSSYFYYQAEEAIEKLEDELFSETEE